MNRILKNTAFALLMTAGLLLTACKGDVVPKPKAYLSLEYPKPEYTPFNDGCAFTFDVNNRTKITKKGACGFDISYPNMKGTIYIDYKPVNNNIDVLLRDAQKLTYEHVIKADDIQEQPFINGREKVYGMFYQVGGNAATNAQFYVTDSTRHFIVGSVYFYTKPNFDSIMPAASYIKNDMRKIMESLRWK
ncbi:gliding motility lipoprotein GldD [Flavobacterium sp. WV_118_3]|jgi:hypothetical protein|uniref:gliding motility lipoprotein GldD n=1 Tax=Flavobacterium sp. WV_118_3 TaxID=3151764 RepID=UPI0012C0D933|nr:gliding motility lipoprotein GldD [Flavobacterium sp.]HRB72117.1 gliding motility lipoprotein GldD [Flavobacterium sp.]